MLVIAGPAGVGKTAAANEVSAQLRAANVAHAVVDTDALDDVFPVPEHQWKVTERNLAFIWETYQTLGTQRLILAGVYLHRPAELAWIQRATNADCVTLVRLTASDATLAARVRGREIGSVHDDQLSRTLVQARELDAERTAGAVEVVTDDRPIAVIAASIIDALDWR